LSEKRERFKYWFVNIFWYHYKPHTIITASVAAVFLFIILTARGTEKPDFVFAIVSDQYRYDVQGQVLAAFLEDRVDDITSLRSDPGAEGHLMLLALTDREYTLFILGESLARRLSDHFSLFYEMEELGFPTGDPYPETLPLDGAALMKTLGLPEHLPLTLEPMFALIKRAPLEKDGFVSPESAARTDLTVECLRVLLDV
jgi:hypothetical protein